MIAQLAVMFAIGLVAWAITVHSGELRRQADPYLLSAAAVAAAIGYLVCAEMLLRLSPIGRVVPALFLALPIAVVAGARHGYHKTHVAHLALVLGGVTVVCALDAVAGRVLLSPDSYSILANASFFRDGVPLTLGALSEVLKRGVTIPVMHSLMPRDGLVSALAPSLCLVLAAAVVGTVRTVRSRLMSGLVPTWTTVGVLMGLIFVPQFQVNFFYLNSHTLIAVAVTALVGLSVSGQVEESTRGVVTIVAGTGLALTLARAEGFLIFVVLLVGWLQRRRVSRRSLLGMMAPAALASGVWNGYVGLQFGEGVKPLVIVAVNVVLALGVLLIAGPLASALRGRPLEAVSVVSTAAVVLLGLLHPRLFAEGLYNCAANVYRFWTPYTAVLMAVAGYAALGGRARDTARHVGLIVIGLAMTMAFAKIFDGGVGSGALLCRPGWGDTLNRSVVHVVGLLVVVIVLAVWERPATTVSPDNHDPWPRDDSNIRHAV